MDAIKLSFILKSLELPSLKTAVKEVRWIFAKQEWIVFAFHLYYW